MSPKITEIPQMKRVIAAGVFVALAASPALAASAKIDAAVKTFRAVSADPAKLKIFCEMKKVMDAAGDRDDPGDDAKIEGFMKQLGSDFQTAWNAGDDVDENSPDGKALNAAIDALAAKCPGG
jgi:hypothetical protein